MRASRDHTNPVVLENGANGPGTKFWKVFSQSKGEEETGSVCSGMVTTILEGEPCYYIPLEVGHPGRVSSLSTQGLPAEALLNSALFSPLSFWWLRW